MKKTHARKNMLVFLLSLAMLAASVMPAAGTVYAAETTSDTVQEAANTADLEAYLDYIEGLTPSDYTAESWKMLAEDYNKVIADQETLLGTDPQDNASRQEAIDMLDADLKALQTTETAQAAEEASGLAGEQTEKAKDLSEKQTATDTVTAPNAFRLTSGDSSKEYTASAEGLAEMKEDLRSLTKEIPDDKRAAVAMTLLEDVALPRIENNKDTAENYAIYVPAKIALTLDLNGKTLTGDDRLIVCAGELTVTDSSKQEGTLGVYSDDANKVLLRMVGANPVFHVEKGKFSTNGALLLHVNDKTSGTISGGQFVTGGEVIMNKAAENTIELTGGLFQSASTDLATAFSGTMFNYPYNKRLVYSQNANSFCLESVFTTPLMGLRKSALLSAQASIDITALEAKIAKAEAFSNEDGKYTEESFNTLQQYLTIAKSAISEEGMADLTQEIADQLAALLQSAIDGLEEAGASTIDTTALEAKIAKAEAISNEDGKYTEESFNTLQQYLTIAKSAISEEGRADLTQEIVDQLVMLMQAALDGLVETESDDTEKEVEAKKKIIEIAEEFNQNKETYYQTFAYKNLEANLESLNYPDFKKDVKFSEFIHGIYENYLQLVKKTEPVTIPDDGVYKTTAKYYIMTSIPSLVCDAYETGYFVKSDIADEFLSAVIDEYVTVEIDGGVVKVTFSYSGEITNKISYICIPKNSFSNLYDNEDYYRSVGDDDSSGPGIRLKDTGGAFSLDMNFLYPGEVLEYRQSSRSRYFFEVDWDNLIKTGDIAIDKSPLVEALEVAEVILGTDTTRYVESTIEAYQEAYNEGKEIYSDNTVTNAEIRNAVAKLNEAREGLVTYKKLLQLTIDAAESVTEDSMSSSKWESLQDVINTAREVYENTGSTTADYRNQIDSLQAAMKSDDSVDIASLLDKIADAEAINNDDEKYTEESYSLLQQYLTIAKAAVSEEGRADLTQEIADQLVTLLASAIEGLEKAEAGNNNTTDFPEVRPTASFNTSLADGTYSVPVYMYNAYDEVASMGNDAIDHTAYLLKNGDELTIHVFFHDMPFLDQYGHLEKLWYYTGANYSAADRREVTAERTEILFNEDTNAYVKTLREGSFVAPHNEASIGCRVQVDAMGDSLQDARLVFDYASITKITDVDTTVLLARISEAESVSGEKDKFTSESYEALINALEEAKNAVESQDLTQEKADAMADALAEAVKGLAYINASENETLEDGVYLIRGDMVKTNREDPSMSDNAINHNIKLTVKDGVATLTVEFKGLTIGTQQGYLGELKYYHTGYTTDQYGRPQGALSLAEILSYQEDENGTRVSDSLGTDYPAKVSFPLISEAKGDGWVPLQVFVPIMENISAGTGTQPVFLKLDWSTLEKTTDDDERFSDTQGSGSGNDPGDNTDTGSKTYTDKATGITVTAPEGAFADEVTLVVEKLTSGDAYDTAKNNPFIMGRDFVLHEIHFENSAGKEVQPEKAVTVVMPVPEGYDSSKIAVYHFSGTSATAVRGTASEDTFTFQASSFSPYAIVHMTTASNGTLTNRTTLDPNNGNTTLNGRTTLDPNNGNSTLSGNGTLGDSSSLTGGNTLTSTGTGRTALATNTGSTLSAPKTGDETNLWLWFILLAASLASLVFIEKKQIHSAEGRDKT